MIDALSLDHKRGAAEIVNDVGELFHDIADYAEEDSAAAEQLFRRAVRRLARGQPSMAPVLNLLNRVCLAWEASDPDWMRFKDHLVVLRESRRRGIEKMIERVGELPRPEAPLIAFSNSSTVAQLILECHRKFGSPRRVFCSEGRPMMEGLILARKLVAGGVEVTLFTDAALMSRTVEAGAVWIGGDSLSSEGLVNKIGSRALAILAKAQGIPFISLMDSNKILSSQMFGFFRLLKQNPREIAADDMKGVEIVNEYYESLPMKLVSAVFTERGLSKPKSLLASYDYDPVSPTFERLVSGSM